MALYLNHIKTKMLYALYLIKNIKELKNLIGGDDFVSSFPQILI